MAGSSPVCCQRPSSRLTGNRRVIPIAGRSRCAGHCSQEALHVPNLGGGCGCTSSCWEVAGLGSWFPNPGPQSSHCTPLPPWGTLASGALLPSMSEMSQLDCGDSGLPAAKETQHLLCALCRAREAFCISNLFIAEDSVAREGGGQPWCWSAAPRRTCEDLELTLACGSPSDFTFMVVCPPPALPTHLAPWACPSHPNAESLASGFAT